LTVAIRKARVDDAERLHELVLVGLEDKTSEVYRENVAKFGIPEDYVRRAFSREALMEAVADEKQLFLVAVEDGNLVGFAQTIRQDGSTAELDRIFLFPAYTGKGIGTQLLNRTLEVFKKEGIIKLTVKAGKGEASARRFYEKNGFQLVEEATVHASWGRDIDLAIYELQIPPPAPNFQAAERK
jgi:N-acetylglutamate synthase-like GNAT family acetyltransferase